jgi:hypothetical protein
MALGGGDGPAASGEGAEQRVVILGDAAETGVIGVPEDCGW